MAEVTKDSTEIAEAMAEDMVEVIIEEAMVEVIIEEAMVELGVMDMLIKNRGKENSILMPCYLTVLG